jgi:hypothetical protein
MHDVHTLNKNAVDCTQGNMTYVNACRLSTGEIEVFITFNLIYPDYRGKPQAKSLVKVVMPKYTALELLRILKESLDETKTDVTDHA